MRYMPVQNSINQRKTFSNEIFIILASIILILIRIIEFEIKTKGNFKKMKFSHFKHNYQNPNYRLIFKVFDTFSLCNLKTKHFLGLVKKRRVGEIY